MQTMTCSQEIPLPGRRVTCGSTVREIIVKEKDGDVVYHECDVLGHRTKQIVSPRAHKTPLPFEFRIVFC